MTTHFMYMSHLSVMLLVLFYMPVCLAVLWILNRYLKTIPLRKMVRMGVRTIIAVPMFLWPTWDAILGKYHLDKLCEEDGGTYISSDAKIEGYFSRGRARRAYAQQALAMGFHYVEYGKNGSYVRYSLNTDGNITEQTMSKILSPYRAGHEDPKTKVGPDYLNMGVSDVFIEEIQSKNRLGGFRDYYVYSHLDKKLEGIGSLPSTRCTSLPKFKKLNRFNDRSRYEKLLSGLIN